MAIFPLSNFCLKSVALDLTIYPAPVFTPFPGERGKFGMDAKIRTHQALHEAKPSECPKGDRDNKSEVYFKNRLFLQTKEPCLAARLFAFYLEYYMQLMQLFALLSGI